MNKYSKKRRYTQNDNDKKLEIMKIANEVAAQMRTTGNDEIKSDVAGSYTGTADDGGPPEQDADDL